MIRLDRAVKRYQIDNSDLLALNYLDLKLEENCLSQLWEFQDAAKVRFKYNRRL